MKSPHLAHRFPIVIVHWVDSSSRRGVWNPLNDLQEDRVNLECVSVGFIVQETTSSITLAGHLTPHQGAGDMMIPKCSITKRTKIKH